MTNESLQEVIDLLLALKEEQDSSKRLREKADKVISILSSDAELAVEKALLELEEMNSGDLSSYHRTQLWDIISLLESINS